MSLKSWKQEFYPITASEAADTLDLVGAVKHAIQKWTGLRKENLDKHECRQNDRNKFRVMYKRSRFQVDTESCSLCQMFLDRNFNCNGCPLFESRGEIRCDGEMAKERNSPYNEWLDTGNPAPMLRALRKALKWAKEHQG